ncbi:MAG: tRNA glutamyl-Q synthetase [Flavobacteriales bacterium]|nr:tRNA glutamyl-Q synthetase [Flavobacteriales bacterium]
MIGGPQPSHLGEFRSPPGGRTRIAPTPSGYLHAGNALNFLITHHIAREAGATVLLRIDDLDAERVRPEYLEDIFETLAWLWIKPDQGPQDPTSHFRNWSQQLRLARYQELAEALRAGGHLYGCTCSRRGRELLRHEGRSTCRCRDRTGDLDDPQAAWRLRVPEDRRVVVRSLFGTDISADLFAVMPDPVLRQRATNGSSARPAYQLASLADDVDQGITFIVRGQDLWPSTVCQVYLAGLLGMTSFREVRFVHHPLLQDQAGNKLSKSEGALSIRAMRGRGADPVELRAMAKAMLTRIEGKAGSGA